MILYIEDNKIIGQNVKEYLESDGYTVDWYYDWEEWLNAATSKYYDCVILDVMLPWIDWFTLCKKIREQKRVPIIMTTAKWTLDDKSEWFEWGADDYLVKPFEIAELSMRISALMKRSDTHDHVEICGLDVYVDENRVVKEWEEIRLTLKERQIFLELLNAWWMTVSRATLIDAVRWWSALFENNDGKLDVYIANLRKKLWKTCIETVKGVWYRLAN